MRVLAITPELPREGKPGSNAPLVRQLDSLRQQGIEIDVIDMVGAPMVKYAQLLPRVRTAARRADLVHAHFGFCGWMGRLQTSCPLVISFMGDDLLGEPNERGSFSKFSRFMVQANKRLAKFAKEVIVKSHEMAGVLHATQAHVIPNGVDIKTFFPIDRAEARKQLGWRQDETVILFPGNADNPRKGFELARAATTQLQEIRDSEVRVERLWNVSPQQVPLLMNACDGMWMTSVVEGSPNVVKEAMACDCPIVSVPVGDVETILSNVDGCCVVDRDASQLAIAMNDILNAEKRSAGHQAIISKQLDLESIARRIIKVYEAALGKTFKSYDREQQSDGAEQESALCHVDERMCR